MTLGQLWRMTTDVKADAGPVRPSTFDEDVSERTSPPVEDYPTGVEGDYTHDPTSNYGYRGQVERPVGVYITDPIPADRPLIEWSGGTATITTVPVSIVGNDRNRARLVFQNLDAAKTVFLVRRQNDLTFTGRAVPPGKDVEMLHCSEVWAVCATGDTAAVTWHIEKRLEENHG
jgi:hypothetical protein